MSMDPYVQFKRGIAKTASYAVKPSDHDFRFTNEGAGGAIVFTLPAIADVWDGWSIQVYVTADQTVTVTAPAGKLVAFNNAAATSLAFSTASEKIGGGITVVYDANSAKYLTFVNLGIETQTPVVS